VEGRIPTSPADVRPRSAHKRLTGAFARAPAAQKIYESRYSEPVEGNRHQEGRLREQVLARSGRVGSAVSPLVSAIRLRVDHVLPPCSASSTTGATSTPLISHATRGAADRPLDLGRMLYGI
jgi:hypothetical protein